MSTADIREAIIEKAMNLPAEEAQKVLIFVTGLDAGFRLKQQSAVQEVENS